MTKELARVMCIERFKDEMSSAPLFDPNFNLNKYTELLRTLIEHLTVYPYQDDDDRMKLTNPCVTMKALSALAWNHLSYYADKEPVGVASIRTHIFKVLFDLNRQIELAGGVDDDQN